MKKYLKEVLNRIGIVIISIITLFVLFIFIIWPLSPWLTEALNSFRN